MKIINASEPDRKPLDRERFLDLEIKRAEHEIGLDTLIQIPLPIFLKEQYLETMETFLSVRERVKLQQEQIQLQRSHNQRTFTSFARFPTELRLKIWELAFESDKRPRVHCLDWRSSIGPEEGTFMSNQPFSSILHVNRESRSLYLEKTQLTFAFETYLNFDTDIFYIPDFSNRKLHFRQFLDFSDSKRIQKLALRKKFFCDIPLPGHFSSAQVEMLDLLEDWGQMLIIFEDNRSAEEVWKDTKMVFREYSAREKRKRAERGYARQQCRVLNTMMDGIEEETMDFRYGCFVSANQVELDGHTLGS